MDIRLFPTKLHGSINAIPSKSQCHRLLILAAFADRPTVLVCPQTNRDMEATAACLAALGAEIDHHDGAFHITPVKDVPHTAKLPVSESGSTLRFLLPVVGALGVDATFIMEGRLPCRPLSPLWEEMERMGCRLTRPTQDTLRCQGKLKSGVFTIAGNVSSQFLTGLLLAFPLIDGVGTIQVTGRLESKPYVDMTLDALAKFGVVHEGLSVKCQPIHSPGKLVVEGDWSNGAFFLAANALGSDLEIGNLNPVSSQGDRAAAVLIPLLREYITIDAGDIPDLVPILSIVAAANRGCEFHNIARLRLKESDRVATVISMVNALGADAHATENTLTISPAPFTGGTVDAAADHRIAMAAAVGATVANAPVTILGAQCTEKSYPSFWAEYARLGGHYEQLLR